MAEMRFTILGSGSSGGVPRIGGHWGDCDPKNPKNRRRRCSMLVERDGPDGTTSVLIDTTPDMRSQLLDAEVSRLDAVVYTHSHADHLHGIDDLRMVYFNMRQRIPVYADGATQNDLLNRFGYAFAQPDNSPYPPILDLQTIGGPFTISGPGGGITFRPFEVSHGSIDSLGFRIGGLAYLPDVSTIPDSALPELEGLDVWILDGLRRTRTRPISATRRRWSGSKRWPPNAASSPTCISTWITTRSRLRPLTISPPPLMGW